jgi:Outer membrane efflux protein
MAESRNHQSVPTPRRFGIAPALMALLLGTQPGCTREFFREWANQDVSEAVFEKSRDPRWRLDTFSVEPPAMSRFADPYDQDFPPAPPDDLASEALSPVPQSPDNRLIMPTEGTGYIEMLERWKDERDSLPPDPKRGNGRRPAAGANGAEDAGPPPVVPNPPHSPSPFVPGAAPTSSPNATTWKPDQKAGADAGKTTPILVADLRNGGAKRTIPPPRPASSFTQSKVEPIQRTRDGAVRQTAQQTGAQDNPAQDVRSGESEKKPPGQQSTPLTPVAPVPLDPNPNERDMADPNLPRPGQLKPEGPAGSFTQEQAAELSGILVPTIPDINEAAAAGLPSDSRPYRVTMQQAFTLALINSRAYQSQLETLYGAALAVTLQRFSFQPQFYAGMSPLTPPLGARFAGPNPLNAFNYQTRFSPGGQVSALQLSEIAGVGKLLNSGGQLLLGFANQVVFNFVGKNPMQPSVQSSLPLSFVQPFLRGGGRAVILEALTQAERSLLYQVRMFAKFRQEFIVAVLAGVQAQQLGTTFGGTAFSTGSNTDPVVGFIPVVLNVAQVEIDRRNVAYFEQLVNLYSQLIEGEASGLSQLQVDQARSSLVSARQVLVQDTITYRNSLDAFKTQLGLPTDLPLIVDLGLAQPFREVWDSIDDWQRSTKRELKDLPAIVGKVPELEDVVIDGRSMLGLYKGSQTYNEEDELDDVLQAGVRTALEYRLDLMNARAQLYDSWRQIRFQANSLKGILNVGVTNQVFTPPTTTNPFGFFSQASQFSLVLNAELPLIRLAERNNFRAALISYQRQRRNLQNTEDALKLQLRNDIRGMQVAAITYEIAKQSLELNIRLKDQAFEQIIAPPQAGAGQGLAQSANAAAQTSNLISFQSNLIRAEGSLLTAWQNFQLARLSLYRDIGTLPYDEWEAFSELFPAEYRGPSLGSGTSDTRSASAPAPETTAALAR